MKNSMWKKCVGKSKCGKLFRCCGKRQQEYYINIDLKQLKKLQKENSDTILLDVRSEQEFNEGYLNGAMLIPLYELEGKIDKAIPNKNTPIIVYCSSGIRSIRAIRILIRKGYNKLYNLYGGTEYYH